MGSRKSIKVLGPGNAKLSLEEVRVSILMTSIIQDNLDHQSYDDNHLCQRADMDTM